LRSIANSESPRDAGRRKESEVRRKHKKKKGGGPKGKKKREKWVLEKKGVLIEKRGKRAWALWREINDAQSKKERKNKKKKRARGERA